MPKLPPHPPHTNDPILDILQPTPTERILARYDPPDAEFAAAVAAYIRACGFHKGDFEDPDSSAVCIRGAARRVGRAQAERSGPLTTGWTRDHLAAHADHRLALLATPVVREMFPGRLGAMGMIHNFNDHPHTTEEDVLAVLDKIAARETISEAARAC